MERTRPGPSPLVGWLLGALLALGAFLPAAAGPIAGLVSAPGAATLVRSSAHQQLDAVTAPQRPDAGPSSISLLADVAAEPSTVPLAAGATTTSRTSNVGSASTTSAAARAPPAVRA